MMNRRQFVQGTAAASALLSATGKAPAQATYPDSGDWYDRPMRWAQINMTEDDPAHMDVPRWLAYFKRIHADAVVLSFGGVVAYYPTDVSYHHRSKWLPGHENFLANFVDAAHRQGMVVMARTDPHATYPDAAAAHPEWIAVDQNGKQRVHPDYPNMFYTCALGTFSTEFMRDVTHEIATRFQVGGVFANRWTGAGGICYCEDCQRRFHDKYGHNLPTKLDAHDPVYRDYLRWEQAELFHIWDIWDKAIQSARPGAHFIANSGGGALSGLDMKRIGELAPTLFADRQNRAGEMATWANGKNGKEYRATMGMKAIGGIFNVGIVSPYRWLNSTNSPAEVRLWVQDGMANGLRPWFNWVGGAIHDPRGLEIIADLYTWHAKWERYFRNTAPIARVGIMYSQQTAQFYAGRADADRLVEQPANGVYQAMLEARIPFEMVHDELLDAEHIDRYKVLLLPNIAALSDAQCQQLRDYVKRGGSIVATYETSLYDENGDKRKDFALGDLFGATFVANTNVGRKVLQNTYLRVEKDGIGSPLLKGGLDQATYLMGGTWQLTTKPTSPLKHVPITRVPAVANLPMEKTYWTLEKTDEPEVYLQEFGKGRVAYFPWDIDRLAWEIMAVDHIALLQNAVAWAANEPAPLRVTGPGFFDTTAWLQKRSATVHLVNMTNANTNRPQTRELIPSQPLHVEVDLPEGVRIAHAHLLMKDAPLPMQQKGRAVSFTVSSVLDYEVVALDFA